MLKRTFVVLALAFAFFGTRCWAQEGGCSGGGLSIPCTFTPTNTTNSYEFFGDGRLTVHFDTVLTTFTLTVTVNHTIDPLDPNEFPAGTVCVRYNGNGGQCDQYDFTGTSAGPNGVPVKNTDYKGLITLTLSYVNVNSSSQTIHTPAFAHAPGDITTFTENILTFYSANPTFIDPTMGGKIPGLSSVGAFDEPLIDNGNDTFCTLTQTPTNNPSGQKPQIEITLKLVSGSNCSGTGLRDKTASISVSTTDGRGNVSFPALKNVEGNKFHWDSKNGVNEYDISMDGLVSGQTYTATVFSSKISPQSIDFVAP